MTFHWYEEVTLDSPLTQGDILFDFPVPEIEETEEFPFFKAIGAEFDLIVMTQACDLENGKVNEISFCILEPVDEIVKRIMRKEMGQAIDFANLTAKQKQRPLKILDELKKGQHLNFHLLKNNVAGINKTTFSMKHKVVYLKNTYKIPVVSANKILQHNENNKYSKRLRLLPPYREHLAQAYANTYERIGLPLDIDIDEIELNLID